MSTAPTISGKAGSAWLIKSASTKPEHTGSIASWLVNVPGAHAFWSYWIVSIVHLRDIPGTQPASKEYPEFEYEFVTAAIDPEKHPKPTPEDLATDGVSLLYPIDVVQQFHGVSDAEAEAICRGAVYAIVEGAISPDADYRQQWKQVITTAVGQMKGKRSLV